MKPKRDIKQTKLKGGKEGLYSSGTNRLKITKIKKKYYFESFDTLSGKIGFVKKLSLNCIRS